MSKSKVLNVESLFTSVAEAGLDPSVLNTTVKMRQASSVVDWMRGEEFMAYTPWARQLEQGVKLYADYCPACTDLKYLEDVPVDDPAVTFLDRVTVLEFGYCPKCTKPKTETFQQWWEAEGRAQYPEYPVDIYLPPNELVSCQGQRSGKTTMVGMFATYQTHRHLCLPDPAAYYGTTPDSPFQIAFVATVVDNALRNMWPNYHSAIKNRPWFRRYAQEIRKQEKQLGLEKESLLKIRDQSVSFVAKNLVANCLAANEGVLRGATRLFSAIDELAFMALNDDAKRANAEITHTVLGNSLLTIRGRADKRWVEGDPHPLTGMLVSISSPAHKFDKIMSLLKEAEKSPRLVGYHLATFEMNPEFPKTHPMFLDAKVRDLTEYMRNYEAIPPLANDTYIKDTDVVRKIHEVRDPIFVIDTEYTRIGSDTFVSGAIKTCVDDKMTPRILAVDPGHTNNAFGIGVYSVVKDGNEYNFLCDGAFAAIPEKQGDQKFRVNFSGMADLIVELCKRLNIKSILFDQWQSIGEIQRLKQLNLPAEQYSPKWADFEAFKATVLSSRFRTPSWEKSIDELNPENVYDLRKNPYAHMGYQIATVQSEGRKVTKPEKGDDDLFRTAVLAYSKVRMSPDLYVARGGPVAMSMAAQAQKAPRVGVMVSHSGHRMTTSGTYAPTSGSGIRGAVRGRSGMGRR